MDNVNVALSRAELGILLRCVSYEWSQLDELAMNGKDKGWRDSKEKDRVLTYERLTFELMCKISETIEEVDNG